MIILVDTRYVLYRSHWTTGTLAASDGTITGALYGLCQTLRSFHESYSKAGETVKFLLCHEGGVPAHRLAFDEYKGGRNTDETVRELVKAQEKIVWNEMPLPQWRVDGFESDDEIASFCNNYPGDEIIVIVSNDGDLWSCLGDRVIIQKSISESPITAKKLAEDYNGILPEYWIYVRAVGGDKSDNIPGIPGYKAKKASKLLMSGTLKEFLQEDPARAEIFTRNFHLMSLTRYLEDWPEPQSIDQSTWNAFVNKYEMVTCMIGQSAKEIRVHLDAADDRDFSFPEALKRR